MSHDLSYISILSTDTYLDGVLLLHYSLTRTRPRYPFHCLVTPQIRQSSLQQLKAHGIRTIAVPDIKNPHNHNHQDRKFYNYSKLNMWGLTQFRKIVYLDADMLVLHNIDELFERPHMSSVNAGGMIKKEWKHLNGGLFVIAPSAEEFQDMLGRIGKIEKSTGQGDQAFLHEYYEAWPATPGLHLPHTYNLFTRHLEAYQKQLGFYIDETVQLDNTQWDDKRIKILHYVGPEKPWDDMAATARSQSAGMKTVADRMWVTHFRAFEHESLAAPLRPKTPKAWSPLASLKKLRKAGQVVLRGWSA